MRVRHALNRLEEILMATLLAAMTLLTFVQVVLRYVFDTGFVWSLEATTYCFAWLVLIGMSQGVRARTHIAIDLLATRLQPAARKGVGLLALALCLLYACLMLYGSLVFFDRLYALGNYARDIPVPRWLLVSILPVGFLLLGIRLVDLAWGVVAGRVAGTGFGRSSA